MIMRPDIGLWSGRVILSDDGEMGEYDVVGSCKDDGDRHKAPQERPD